MWSVPGPRFVEVPPAPPLPPTMYYNQPLNVVVGPPPVVDRDVMRIHPAIPPTSRRPRPHTAARRSKSAGRERRSPENRDALGRWSEWRTEINDGLGRDLVTQRYRRIPIGEEYDDLISPPTRSRHGVYHYSTAVDQATQLQKEDFVNFGIPRAQLRNQPVRRGSPSNSSSSSDSEQGLGDRPYSISKLKDRTAIEKAQQRSNHVYRERYADERGGERLIANGRRERSRERRSQHQYHQHSSSRDVTDFRADSRRYYR